MKRNFYDNLAITFVIASFILVMFFDFEKSFAILLAITTLITCIKCIINFIKNKYTL